jgi:hypothetical protein
MLPLVVLAFFEVLGPLLPHAVIAKAPTEANVGNTTLLTGLRVTLLLPLERSRQPSQVGPPDL